jgi:hypothetical protein
MTNNHLSRKTVLRSTAWSVPVVAIGAAAPAFAASGFNCNPIEPDPAAATYTRESDTVGFFTWANIFGEGKDLVMKFTSTLTSGNTSSVITPGQNLQYTTGSYGGWTRGGVTLALTSTSTEDVDHQGQDVRIEFFYDGSPTIVNDIRYRVSDIDGAAVTSAGPGTIQGGAERVWFAQGATGRLVAPNDFLAGDGSMNNPFRRQVPSVPAAADAQPTDGFATVVNNGINNVNVVRLRFRVNNSGRNVDTVSRVWVAPPMFEIANLSAACAG